MDFYEEIVKKVLQTGTLNDSMIKEIAKELAQEAAFQALHDIYEILDDDTLEDASCFKRIEEIVTIYEKLGPGGGSRHDFG